MFALSPGGYKGVPVDGMSDTGWMEVPTQEEACRLREVERAHIILGRAYAALTKPKERADDTLRIRVVNHGETGIFVTESGSQGEMCSNCRWFENGGDFGRCRALPMFSPRVRATESCALWEGLTYES